MLESYYVSIVRSGKYRLLKGPYATKEEAEAQVEDGRNCALAYSEKHWWDAFGTCKIASDNPPLAIFGV